MYLAYAARDSVYFNGVEYRSIAYVQAITNVLTYNCDHLNAIKFKQLDSIQARRVRELQMESETIHGFIPAPSKELASAISKHEYGEALHGLEYVAQKSGIIILPYLSDTLDFPGARQYGKKLCVLVIDPVNMRRTFAAITKQSQIYRGYFLNDIDGERRCIIDHINLFEYELQDWLRQFRNHPDIIDTIK